MREKRKAEFLHCRLPRALRGAHGAVIDVEGELEGAGDLGINNGVGGTALTHAEGKDLQKTKKVSPMCPV